MQHCIENQHERERVKKFNSTSRVGGGGGGGENSPQENFFNTFLTPQDTEIKFYKFIVTSSIKSLIVLIPF